MKVTADIDRLLSEHVLFRGLGRGERLELLRRASHVFLDPDERLYTAGEPARQVFVLLAGAIQIEYPEAPETRGFVATMISAPGFLGECQVLHERVWSGTGVALFPTVALGIHREVLEQLLLTEPAVALALYRELSWRFLGAIDSWKHQQSAPPAECLARYLLSYLATARCVNPEQRDAVRVSQADLGRATGLRRETVNRILRSWERKGWLQLRMAGLEALDEEALGSLLPEGDRRLLVRSARDETFPPRSAARTSSPPQGPALEL